MPVRVKREAVCSFQSRGNIGHPDLNPCHDGKVNTLRKAGPYSLFAVRPRSMEKFNAQAKARRTSMVIPPAFNKFPTMQALSADEISASTAFLSSSVASGASFTVT